MSIKDMGSYRRGILFGFIFLFGSYSIFAQNTGIKGRVVDVQGAVIPGIELVVVNEKKKKEFRITTDSSGEYSLSLSPGKYSIEIGNDDRSGFCAMILKNYIVPKFNGMRVFDILMEQGKCSHCDLVCKKKVVEF